MFCSTLIKTWKKKSTEYSRPEVNMSMRHQIKLSSCWYLLGTNLPSFHWISPVIYTSLPTISLSRKFQHVQCVINWIHLTLYIITKKWISLWFKQFYHVLTRFFCYSPYWLEMLELCPQLFVKSIVNINKKKV
jgi:hypothetical protein